MGFVKIGGAFKYPGAPLAAERIPSRLRGYGRGGRRYRLRRESASRQWPTIRELL